MAFGGLGVTTIATAFVGEVSTLEIVNVEFEYNFEKMIREMVDYHHSNLLLKNHNRL